MSATPTLRVERELLRTGVTLLASMDEVGRGALAGPVTVGVVVIDVVTPTAPKGVRDSKLLTAEARHDLDPRIRRWAVDHAVGCAGPDEIDSVGLTAALRLAGERALARLSVRPDRVLLDGSHDWLTRPPTQGDLFAEEVDESERPVSPPVITRIKADLTCASVAAASVIAKVHRDAHMVELDSLHSEWSWRLNKGYSSPEHLDALSRREPSVHHRRSWRLPAVETT